MKMVERTFIFNGQHNKVVCKLFFQSNKIVVWIYFLERPLWLKERKSTKPHKAKKGWSWAGKTKSELAKSENTPT
jgi:hypothetical protein